MLSNRARLALTDIRDNIRLADQFAVGLSVEALKGDRRSFYAITRCLEIISEAAHRLPQGLRNRHPELPWRAIMAAGNVYRHDYDNVAEESLAHRPEQPRATPRSSTIRTRSLS
jgi:uncharacterized protein with HEPN domain